ncbi:MAG: hypothetical protein QOD56_1054 [Gammaproteobacteria bacterium]|jgi:hypothetical protein|nr:hypothetical protein [Gammaproteobacteria bacterium]
MKLIVIVPLVITIDVPARQSRELYDSEKILRRDELLAAALNKVRAEADVEFPDTDNEGVIFLDENEEELANELDET